MLLYLTFHPVNRAKIVRKGLETQSTSVGCLRRPGMDCKWCLVKTREWRSINLHGGIALLGDPKSPGNRRYMNSRKNGVDTTLTNHKKNVQPEMNHARNVGKLDILPKCAEVGETMSTCWMKWTISKIPVRRRRVLTGIWHQGQAKFLWKQWMVGGLTNWQRYPSLSTWHRCPCKCN